eukprot:CAMPEP_0113318030 /NCGR_PEP_ID=MMETSP0010_2-20120614/12738_1 /TAXON_ID=216773 ORGANISM="Corethron hystrix, Strain 308" /NCGR_SAMPLE_ID=MMETSP0010_2 /ASSEMBLY_ACC=CAM_ASM_000155 /LENGTH=367 /DNA_ID=CAMNT_0000175203 /DNA_START=87 /DNA_END=1187 /DNA_ORIENTATION=+ /assembly_acc=CAM_ASM_000155
MAKPFPSPNESKESKDMPPRKMKGFIDIGANLLDPMFNGIYHGKFRHTSDLDLVLKRAFSANPPVSSPNDGMSFEVNHGILESLFITAGTIDEGKESLSLARKLNSEFSSAAWDGNLRNFYSTVGIHPTRCSQELGLGSTDTKESIPPGALNDLKNKLLDVISDGRIDNTLIAIGECGLDYERENFCHRSVQHVGFLAHLDVAEQTGLPLFLHNRNTGQDLLSILQRNREKFPGGAVVHSFDDTLELAMSFIDLGLYLGLNGCSIKTSENLEVVRCLPLDRILLETDCPWCEVKRTHVGYKHIKTDFETRKDKKFEPGYCVKGRNEPCHIVRVAEVIAGVRGISVDEVANSCYENTVRFFGKSMGIK